VRTELFENRRPAEALEVRPRLFAHGSIDHAGSAITLSVVIGVGSV
jgi:hypothetical protein